MCEAEVANRNHVALEARRRRDAIGAAAGQVEGSHCAGCNRRSGRLRSRSRTAASAGAVVVQRAVAGLSGSSERIRRGIRERNTSIEARLVGNERE